MNDVGLHLVLESILAGSLLFLGGAYWRLQNKKELMQTKLEETATSVQDQLTALHTKVQHLEQTVQPLTEAMATVLVKSLTDFHNPEVDALLAKVGPSATRLEEKRRASEKDQ
jgi:hypothetical protein